MVQNLFIQVFHKRRVIICIFLFAGHTVKHSRSVDPFRQRPVHTVMNHRSSVPVRGVHNPGRAVRVPGIGNRTVVKVFGSLNIGRPRRVVMIGGKRPLGNEASPLQAMSRRCAVGLELVVRTFLIAGKIRLPVPGKMFRNPPAVVL